MKRGTAGKKAAAIDDLEVDLAAAIPDCPSKRRVPMRRRWLAVAGGVCFGSVLFLLVWLQQLRARNGPTLPEVVAELKPRAPGHGSGVQVVAAPGQGVDDDTEMEERDEAELEMQVGELDSKVRALKATGIIMESNKEAKVLTGELQQVTRVLLRKRYGPEPYRVELELRFPDSMAPDPVSGTAGRLVLEMAPMALMPHAVFTFLEIVRTFRGGSFHRVAPHVLQAQVTTEVQHLAFQEYSPKFPHVVGSVGYAGRPSGPGFYISTQDNVRNHGPGSQQHKNPYEADACFAKVVEGYKEVVPRIRRQPGVGPGAGFVSPPSNYIQIVAAKLQKIQTPNAAGLHNAPSQAGGESKSWLAHMASQEVAKHDARVRELKATGITMETNPDGLAATGALQEATRKLLTLRYGKEPYRVRLELKFPASTGVGTKNLVFQMAPASLMPHAVFTFLELARTWRGGFFYRKAPHVLQARPSPTEMEALAFQEYSSKFPHVVGSVGYAGRPSGPEFYISIQDNTVNHGPGSQQDKNPYEADSCFATVVEGFDSVVPLLSGRDVKTDEMGFFEDEADYVRITSVTIL